MIISKLAGGLGNQMFQYAAGRRLAAKHNSEFKLDVRLFQDDPLRAYALDCFSLHEKIATAADIFSLTREPERGIWHRLFRARRRFGMLPNSYFNEPHIHFCPKVLDLPDNTYLAGYWQSEAYFADIGDIIRKDFQWKTPPTDFKLAERIANCNSVSLHIRRGDYALNAATNKTHGLLPLSYYERAVRFIAEKENDPVLFIFSDDPKWAQNLKFDFPSIVVSNSTTSDHEDLQLLTLCKSHIVANSSYSWWGAWLSENSRKTVVAPHRWFSNEAFKLDGRFPDGWIVL